MSIQEGVDFSILDDVPLLKDFYDETYVYAIVKDPWSTYVIYEISEKTKEELKLQFGNYFFERNYLIMNVYEVNGQPLFNGFNYNHKFEVDDFLNEKNNYWLRITT